MSRGAANAPLFFVCKLWYDDCTVGVMGVLKIIQLQTSLIWPECAQGKYTVKAKGCILAVLRWGDDSEPLQDWGPFAYVPVDPAGNGAFDFEGRRGIPPGATHVWARCYAADFASFEDACAEIPQQFQTRELPLADAQHFSILTDLHLASKPWKIKRALRAAQSDTVFLLGDSTNDGRAEQFEAFRACIAEAAPEKNLFPVTGNHDVLHGPRGDLSDGCRHYAAFQKELLAKCGANGHAVTYAPDGRAYAARMGLLDVIGLQCVTSGRKFLFPEKIQLDWLEKHLAETEAAWHIILCHAPLLAHNPNRNEGPPYLDGNRHLQEMIDKTGRVLFLNGHTHVSPNVLRGNGEYDEVHRNIYLDCASAVATDTSGETGLMSPDWKDGCITGLTLAGDTVEICMRSLESGIRFPRGYYRFRAAAKEP